LQDAEAPAGEGGKSAKADCMDWLRDYLGFEEVDGKEVKAAAKTEGYTDKVLRDAREALNIAPRREGRRRNLKSWWSLPTGCRPFVPQSLLVPSNPIDAHIQNEGTNKKKGTSKQIPMTFQLEEPE